MTAEQEGAYTVDHVAALDCRFEREPWGFATENHDAIARHWAEAVQLRPQMFDGQVLMQSRGGIDQGPGGAAVFRATYTDVSFSAFLAWRDFGRPTRGLRNGFGMAALQGADGAFILGEMGAHTANAGRVYFPSGTPDLDDVRDEVVDIEGSIRRELGEETGLDPAELAFEPGITVIQDPYRVCFLKRARAAEPADDLVARITATLAGEALPELTRMHIVRSAADITAAMPPFVALYLRRAFAADQPG